MSMIFSIFAKFRRNRRADFKTPFICLTAPRYRRVDAGAQGAEYLIASRWSDEEAFRAFVASEAFKKVTSWGLAHILAGRPTHTTYREG